MNTLTPNPWPDNLLRMLELTGSDGLTLRLMNHGATWLSCQVPLPDGSRREVLLGGPSPQAQQLGRAYMGATVGRYANRIANATLQRDGDVIALTPNPGSRHQLHGGPGGLDTRVWEITSLQPDAVTFSLHSPAGEQGFPGNLRVQVSYRLSEPGCIEMETVAEVDAPCPLALTNHAYFNLDATHADARTQRLRVAAAQVMPVDAELIPFGPPVDVAGSSFDFRRPQVIGSRWLADEQQRLAGGYDHAWLLDESCADAAEPAAVLQSGDGRLQLSVHTSLPALQVYTGQFLGTETGRDGRLYAPCAGVALEPGFLPDSPNHPEWPQPSCWLRPGQVSRHRTVYHFDAMA
jgi:aldose 1-epimerase